MTRRKQNGTPATINHHVEYGEAYIEDPYFITSQHESRTNTRFITAIRNYKESPLGYMHKRKDLYPSYMVTVALRFHGLYRVTEGSSLLGIDTTREPVQGGKMSDGLTQQRMDASKEREIIKRVLGPEGFELVNDVCGKEIFLSTLFPKRRKCDKMTELFKNCLHSLAIFWRMVPPNTHYTSKWSGSVDKIQLRARM